MTMDLSDRELLIKIEQKLHDSISNYKQMAIDLKEIFGKIETNSKSIVQIETNLETALNKLKTHDNDFKEVDKEIVKLTGRISTEETERSSFENNIKGGQRVWKIVVTLITSIAALFSIVSIIIALGLKFGG